MAFPPVTSKRTAKSMNRKERRLALDSAIAATGSKDLVRERGHKFDEDIELPLVVTDEVEKFAKDIGEVSKLIRTRLYALSATDRDTDLLGVELGWDISAGECDNLIGAHDKITEIDQFWIDFFQRLLVSSRIR